MLLTLKQSRKFITMFSAFHWSSSLFLLPIDEKDNDNETIIFFLIGHLVRLVDIILMAESILAVLPIQSMTDQDDKAFMYLMFTAYWIREDYFCFALLQIQFKQWYHNSCVLHQLGLVAKNTKSEQISSKPTKN